MKIYLFGGALRDRFTGRSPKDLDYFVEGINPEHFMSSQRQRFEVIRLQSCTLLKRRNENGVVEDYIFDEHSSIHDKLRRSDFTINSFAEDLETGEIISPYLERAWSDIRHKILHLSVLEEKDTSRFAVDFLRITYMILKNRDFEVPEALKSLLSRRAATPRDAQMIQALYPANLEADPLKKAIWIAKFLATGQLCEWFDILESYDMIDIMFPAFSSADVSKWEHLKEHLLVTAGNGGNTLDALIDFHEKHAKGQSDLHIALQDRIVRSFYNELSGA